MLAVSKDIKTINLNIGGYAEGSTALNNKTGGWRTFKPVLSRDKCVDCMICWIYCPDDSIVVKDGKMIGFDYEYCKGCRVCANVCPRSAIEMVSER
ncbi:MAG: 4Fe-4S binding protein [Spirochaetia bacterium]|nr:4Fe-4S binding protein [Spirochaetota bacterium]MCX8097228.1 4Fe-4S binding protein [Spirochaetota bacterium]MDW8111982.1 4Fe-4S binding protein [Spirochaetia bacterium]